MGSHRAYLAESRQELGQALFLLWKPNLFHLHCLTMGQVVVVYHTVPVVEQVVQQRSVV